MNANELIDKLRSASIKLLGKETEQAGRAIILYRESAIMLQQQAKEIEALKKEAALQRLSDFTQEAENKPVAWTTDKLDTNEWEEGDYQITVTKEKWSKKQIPLYTHPMRELTDEEIQDLWAKMNWSGHPELEFARAILKRASEK